MYVRPLPRRHSAQQPDGTDRVRAFHQRFPGYTPTPLVEVPAVAAELGVGRVLVKDESHRLGLPAFKILGASWAIARVLSERFGLPGGAAGVVDIGELQAAMRSAPAPTVFTTATDGNHGRAVARMAALLDGAADVFVPAVLEPGTIALIAGEGARVHVVAGDYDDAVRRAAEHADETGAILVQDTAWAGYERVPTWIVEGYSTMLTEIDDGLTPDLVVVPAGVGSLTQAVVTHYRPRAHVLTVEPDTADCIHRSLLAGEPVVVETGQTAMAGLNCGTPSSLAWPVLRDGLSGAVTVSEEQDAAAIDTLARHGVAAGPCGAATLAGARLFPLAELGLGHGSTVVLLSTEGPR